MSAPAGAAGFVLSGFGDEIDADPQVQLAVLAALGATAIEVRSAWGVNIVELADERVAELAHLIAGAGFAVSAVASPIGKVDLRAPQADELARLDRALAAAQALGSRFVRVFSFQHDGAEASAVRAEVVERMGTLAERAAAAGLILLLENELGVYGDTPAHVHDVLAGVASPALRFAWDAGNFVRAGARPFDDAYALLRPYLSYLQVKDAVPEQGSVPAGAGHGQLRETVRALVDDGFAGFASLEPHLATAGRFGGFTGPRNFGVAARAFAGIVTECGGQMQ
ncbi:sugar phosphate isomerase/epimerase family protein [Gryllotalpicola reticulitermitis]|uniref:Sugar phosphate isomerase/epimerase family protein n=1 Tax=Gryllotalpicola reticulitermitis TaxID=1184153 RepID=A0ABV8QA92_9MICO